MCRTLWLVLDKMSLSFPPTLLACELPTNWESWTLAEKTTPSLDTWGLSHFLQHKSACSHSSFLHLWTMYLSDWWQLGSIHLASFWRTFPSSKLLMGYFPFSKRRQKVGEKRFGFREMVVAETWEMVLVWFVDRFRFAFKERLGHFDWLRWVEGVNAVIKVVDEVKTKTCNGL